MNMMMVNMAKVITLSDHWVIGQKLIDVGPLIAIIHMLQTEDNAGF